MHLPYCGKSATLQRRRYELRWPGIECRWCRLRTVAREKQADQYCFQTEPSRWRLDELVVLDGLTVAIGIVATGAGHVDKALRVRTGLFRFLLVGHDLRLEAMRPLTGRRGRNAMAAYYWKQRFLFSDVFKIRRVCDNDVMWVCDKFENKDRTLKIEKNVCKRNYKHNETNRIRTWPLTSARWDVDRNRVGAARPVLFFSRLLGNRRRDRWLVENRWRVLQAFQLVAACSAAFLVMNERAKLGMCF